MQSFSEQRMEDEPQSQFGVIAVLSQALSHPSTVDVPRIFLTLDLESCYWCDTRIIMH